MSATNEYSESITQGMKSYATLGCYYGAGSTMPALKPNQVNQRQIVPMWGGISYDALTHGVDCNNTYFNITNAYGAGAETCSTSYAQRLCGGCNDKPGQGMGWRCHPGTGKCLQDGHLGAQGVFKSAYQCQENCKQSQEMGWRCHPGNSGGKGKCLQDGHLGAQGVFKSAYQCQENCKSVV